MDALTILNPFSLLKWEFTSCFFEHRLCNQLPIFHTKWKWERRTGADQCVKYYFSLALEGADMLGCWHHHWFSVCFLFFLLSFLLATCLPQHGSEMDGRDHGASWEHQGCLVIARCKQKPGTYCWVTLQMIKRSTFLSSGWWGMDKSIRQVQLLRNSIWSVWGKA